jgi:hypothetical protein
MSEAALMFATAMHLCLAPVSTPEQRAAQVDVCEQAIDYAHTNPELRVFTDGAAALRRTN